MSLVKDHYVEVTFTGGGGSGAKGRAVITAGAVTGVTMTSGGIGYSSSPTAVFTRKHDWKVGPWGLDGVLTAPVSGDVTATGTGTENSSATITTLRKGNLIKITKADGLDFTISSEDGLGNTGLGVIYKEVESMTDLPKPVSYTHLPLPTTPYV